MGAAPGPVYAAVDLGTNNCRMLMARPDGAGFEVLDAYSRVTRLGEGIEASGALSEPAMRRTVAVLKVCAERMARGGVTRARHVATEACRRAGNCDEFVERVMAATGLRLEIVSPREEAMLALAGCAALLDPGVPDALVVDIGGGSTELMHVRLGPGGGGQEVLAFESLPLGVVTLWERAGALLETAEGYAEVVDNVEAMVRRFEAAPLLSRLLDEDRLQLLGTSGTVTTVAALHLGLPRYDRSSVDGTRVPLAAVRPLCRELVTMSPRQRARNRCIGRNRAQLVLAGCAILEAVCRVWPVAQLAVADRGVREGVLLGMMREDANLAEVPA